MEKFIKKDKSLRNVLKKIEAKLQWFSNNHLSLCEEVKRTWNQWHDLQTRIENRIWDNWSASKDANWDLNQFNAY